jgi:hypothetical protein
MNYYAYFIEACDMRFRLDTRIYLEDGSRREEDGVCVAAVVGKNPGSAYPAQMNKWAPLIPGRDKLLPYVRNRFLEGYRLAGKTIPPGAFVRVGNLFYLCNADLDSALESISQVGSQAPICSSEKSLYKIVWFAWGGRDLRLNPFKARFQKMKVKFPFFFDKDSGSIVERIPSEIDFAKHTQGLRAKPVEEYLASIL